jgi:hypothetical protein
MEVGGVERGVVELCRFMKSRERGCYVPIVASSGGGLLQSLRADGILHLVSHPSPLSICPY